MATTSMDDIRELLEELLGHIEVYETERAERRCGHCEGKGICEHGNECHMCNGSGERIVVEVERCVSCGHTDDGDGHYRDCIFARVQRFIDGVTDSP